LHFLHIKAANIGTKLEFINRKKVNVANYIIETKSVTYLLVFSLISKFINQNQKKMSIWRVLLAILFPPLSVIGKGCGSIIIVFLLTLCGWVPGVIAALVILNNRN